MPGRNTRVNEYVYHQTKALPNRRFNSPTMSLSSASQSLRMTKSTKTTLPLLRRHRHTLSLHTILQTRRWRRNKSKRAQSPAQVSMSFPRVTKIPDLVWKMLMTTSRRQSRRVRCSNFTTSQTLGVS